MSVSNQETISVSTTSRTLIEITDKLNAYISMSRIEVGLLNVFCQHTSASLLITENADPTVLDDLETIFTRLAPDGDPEYRHNYEGDDDMAAHVRSALTSNNLNIPIKDQRLALGTWQGVFLWEHRYRGRTRNLVITITS